MGELRSKRNGEIEFLRFLFCNVILLFHGKEVMTDGKIRMMFSGRLGVEFFFLVSGYLMAAQIAKVYQSSGNTNVGKQTEQFLLRKIKAVYPAVIVAFFMFYFTILLYEKMTMLSLLKKMVKGASNLALLQMSGFQFEMINGTWYISSMLICMAILYPLLLRFYPYMRRVGVALLSVLLLGYLMEYRNGMNHPFKMLHQITYAGNIRAMAELSLGCLVYEGAQQLKQIQLSPFGRTVLTIAQLGMYLLTFAYILLNRGSKLDFYVLVILAGGVMLTFSECSWIGKYFNNRFCLLCGKSSLYIYLAHISAVHAVKGLFSIIAVKSNITRMAIFVVAAYIFTGILWGLSQCTSYVWKKTKAVMVNN